MKYHRWDPRVKIPVVLEGLRGNMTSRLMVINTNDCIITLNPGKPAVQITAIKIKGLIRS